MTGPTTSSPGRRLRRAADHALAVPLLLAVLVCLVGAHVALSAPIPSWANDEAPHLGYVVTLSDGELPTIDSPIIAGWEHFPERSGELMGWDPAHRDIWVANHPPLYHLALVPIWDLLGDDLSHAVIAMRLVNTLGYGAWILLVGLIARELVPRRPAVPALASVVALTPTLALRAGYLMNDGWGCAAALLLTLLTIRMLRGGPSAVTWGRVVAAAGAGTLAAGTRAPGVLVVATCSLALLLCLRRSGRGLAAAVVVGGVPAAATSWFYLRNLRLYGDLTGQDALIAKFERTPIDSWIDLVRVRGLWEPVEATWIPVVVFLAVVPALLVRRIRAGALRPGRRPDPAWSLLVAQAGLTAGNIVGFLQIGGGFHDRYLMPVMPLLATTTALAMLALHRPWLTAVGGRSSHAARREWRLATAWATALLLWFAGAFGFNAWYHVFRGGEHHPVEGPAPVLLLLGAATAGVLVLVVMVRRTAIARPEPVPARERVREAA